MTGEEITRVGFGDDQDAFAIRRLAREIAERVGLEAQDRIRMATALSEIVREVLALGGEGVVIISLTEESLIMTVDYRVGEDLRQSEGMALAGRLVDEVVHAEPGSITLVKRVPAHVARRSPAEVRAGLSPVVRVTAMDELREQNRELAGTLEEGQRLNVELTETNKGILALYNQLSAELEETNRGVVALYAELEEKSARLRELAEARQRFWVSVSHELRTPLNSIIGLVRLLLGPGGEPLSEEQEHQIRLIGSSAETLLAMVSELLDMAKAESGRIQPQPVPVDVAALADEARTTTQAWIPSRWARGMYSSRASSVMQVGVPRSRSMVPTSRFRWSSPVARMHASARARASSSRKSGSAGLALRTMTASGSRSARTRHRCRSRSTSRTASPGFRPVVRRRASSKPRGPPPKMTTSRRGCSSRPTSRRTSSKGPAAAMK